VTKIEERIMVTTSTVAGNYPKMNQPISVMILSKTPWVRSNLKSDLITLGFKPLKGKYPNVYTDDIARKRPAIIMLDLTAFDDDTPTICKALLRENVLPSETALVAIVSEHTMEQTPMEDKFKDVIKFPYHIAELNFRLRRVMSTRHQEVDDDTIHMGKLSISPSNYEVKVDGRPVILSHREYELFKYLITHPNYVFTREKLLASIWGNSLNRRSRTVDVHIRRVRAKIGDSDEKYIRTVRRIGYAFRYNTG
jgi:DNA-binding response OmpR family regulator